jgi:hypothetical protein
MTDDPAAHDVEDTEGSAAPAPVAEQEAPTRQAPEEASTPGKAASLAGEMSWTARGTVVTTLLAVSGILLVRGGAELIARYALGLKKPATVTMTARGLEVAYRVELLGRVIRERHSVYPMENLVSVTREIRFARAGTYAGLLALVVGTYLGVGVIADGVRAPGGSATLIAIGVVVVAVGLALDYAFTTFLDSARRRVRLVVTPRRGRPFCVGGLPEDATDALLKTVASV